jgi:GAF domain-containing protein
VVTARYDGGTDSRSARKEAIRVSSDVFSSHPELWSSIAEAGSVETLGEITRTAARQVADSEGATFVLREGDHCFYADEDSVAPLWKGQRFPIDECISGWAMRNGEPAVIPDIRTDERIPQAAYSSTYVRSLVMVPVGSPAVAAIGAYWATGSRGAPTLPALVELAGHVAATLGRIGLSTAPWAPTFSSPVRAEG